MADDVEGLTRAWEDAQAALPEGWRLDSLRCASAGLGTDERSADWIAVAVGPHGEEQGFAGPDPYTALTALIAAIG